MNTSVQSIMQVVFGNVLLKDRGMCLFILSLEGHFIHDTKIECLRLIQVVKICETLDSDTPNRFAKQMIQDPVLSLVM